MRILKAKNFFQVIGAVAALSTVGMGCNGASDERQVEEQTGHLSVECVGGMSTHGVSAVRFVVVGTEGTCADTPIAEKVVTALESESIPASLLPAGGGSAHPFADGLFTLAPGSYRVCATPLAAGIPSAECGMVDTTVLVKAELTTEIVLMSQCKGDPTGAIDAVLGLNDPPKIGNLTVTPSKFISVCERATITVEATDPNGDTMTYSGTVVSGPTGTPGSLTFAGKTGTFIPGSPGDYQVKVTVTDPVGGITSLQFPMHVTTASCTLVSMVGDKDDFTAGDPADIPELAPGFEAQLPATPDWNPRAALDDVGVNRMVAFSHVYALPPGLAIQTATLRLRVKASECWENDAIYFQPTSDSTYALSGPRTIIALQDLGATGSAFEATIDLSAVPVRNIVAVGGGTSEPGICEAWSNPALDSTKGVANLLPLVATGTLNLLSVDDTAIDYSELTIKFAAP